MTAGPIHGTGHRARHPPPRPGARCRAVRFFTHLPAAGPPPGKTGGPGRTHKGRAGTARPRQASVRPPGHARPRTSQDTGQTTARRSPGAHTRTGVRMHARKGVTANAGNRKRARKNTIVIHPEWLSGPALSAII